MRMPHIQAAPAKCSYKTAIYMLYMAVIRCNPFLYKFIVKCWQIFRANPIRKTKRICVKNAIWFGFEMTRNKTYNCRLSLSHSRSLFVFLSLAISAT